MMRPLQAAAGGDSASIVPRMIVAIRKLMPVGEPIWMLAGRFTRAACKRGQVHLFRGDRLLRGREGEVDDDR